MKASDKEAADYLAGKLQLVTSRSTGKTKLVPYKKRSYDKGITPPAKRAYWRVWYLKNRKKRQAYSAARKAKPTTPGLPDHVVQESRARAEDSRLAKKRAYTAQWRKKNAARLPEMRKKWTKKTAAPVASTPAERKAVYIKQWRAKNRDKINAQARAKYQQSKLGPKAAFIAGALGADRVVAVTKPSLLQRFLGWF